GLQRRQPPRRQGQSLCARIAAALPLSDRRPPLEGLAGVRRRGRAAAGFRLHRLRPDGGRGLPALARPAHDGPLGRPRSRRLRRQRGRKARPLRRRLRPALQPHLDLRQPAARFARSALAAAAPRRGRPRPGQAGLSPKAREPMSSVDLPRRLAAEALGTALLVAVVVGSGIMGERLAGGNDAIALLGNTLATGAALPVLILVFGPLSGAHFNPVVSASFALRRTLSWSECAAYIPVQIAGAIAGTLLAHLMFGEPLLQASTHVRTGLGVWTGEIVATFALLLTIL